MVVVPTPAGCFSHLVRAENVRELLCMSPRRRCSACGSDPGLIFLQVYGESDVGHAACICVHKKKLYDTVKVLRQMGGSGVLVSPMTYIFDEEPQRWKELLQELGLKSDPLKSH